MHVNPLSNRSLFWAFFEKYRKFERNFVTQFFRNGSTKTQSFVYYFVENFKLLHENVKVFSIFSQICPELQLSDVPLSSTMFIFITCVQHDNFFIKYLSNKIRSAKSGQAFHYAFIFVYNQESKTKTLKNHQT